MAAPLRILSHMPEDQVRVHCEGLPVEIVKVPYEGDPPADLRGEVLLTMAWGSPNLKALVERGVRWIHTVGTGVDRFPFEAVGEQVITCARGATAGPIAEWVLAMLLAFEKQLPEAWASEPPERWSMRDLGTLEGRSLGLVGLGTIAQAVAVRALPFGMRVQAYRKSDAPSPVAGVEILRDLRGLAETSDHLVVAAAATPATRHLISREILGAVRPGAHLVNVARGSLVDQDALRETLDAGRLARASLDTVEPEPLPADSWLYRHPGVRLSPHISWNAPGAIAAILATFGVNLRRYLAGEPLEHVVDPARGY